MTLSWISQAVIFDCHATNPVIISLSVQKKDFAELIKKTRRDRGWTQGELADRSSIATRTIVAAENGKEFPKKEIVIRLAHTLGQNIDQWLKWSNQEASALEVNEIIRASGHLHFAGEESPELFFSRLVSRLQSGEKLLMIVCYNSIPGATSHKAVKDALINAVHAGLVLAMCCPYGAANSAVMPEFTDLNLYRNSIYNTVVGLAAEVHYRTSDKGRGDVAVFTPDYQSEGHLAFVVPPPLGLADYRPTLLFNSAKRLDDPTGYELAAWFTMRQDHRHRWLPIYPAQAADEEYATLHLRYWRNYFSEIIAARLEKGWNRAKLKAWQLQFPQKNENTKPIK